MKAFYTIIILSISCIHFSYADECNNIKTKIQSIRQERERIVQRMRNDISDQDLEEFRKKLKDLERERQDLVARGFEQNCFVWEG